MIRILAVCAAGMGTSMIIKMKVQDFLDANGIEADVESCGLHEADGSIRDRDVIICSSHISEELKIPADKKLIELNNMMDENEYAEKLLAVLK